MNILTVDFTSDGRVRLDGYLQAPSSRLINFAVRPAVLILPGGGYRGISEREGEPVALAFLAAGYNAFVLHYSVGTAHAAFPAPLNEVSMAIGMLRERAAEWRIDPARVAVCGFSAGGHLAAAAGTMAEHRPNAMILCYPCIVEEVGAILAVPVPGVDKAVNAATPPAFIFHTRDDKTVPVQNAVAMASAMEKAGIPFELHIYRSGWHGASLATAATCAGDPRHINPAVAAWFPRCLQWLDETWQAQANLIN